MKVSELVLAKFKISPLLLSRIFSDENQIGTWKRAGGSIGEENHPERGSGGHRGPHQGGCCPNLAHGGAPYQRRRLKSRGITRTGGGGPHARGWFGQTSAVLAVRLSSRRSPSAGWTGRWLIGRAPSPPVLNFQQKKEALRLLGENPTCCEPLSPLFRG